MIKLIDYTDRAIWRGNILKVFGKWPYEEYVDFMVFETLQEENPLGLIVTSGYKAGLILVVLPKEAISSDVLGINKEWLILNWNKWVYPDCNVKDVYIFNGYKSESPE